VTPCLSAAGLLLLIGVPHAVKKVPDMTGGCGADVVLDIVGINHTLQMSAGLVKRLGLIMRSW
jgi:threonine dehydrogenase-like Zn-dependent dehydrogenase